MRRQMKIVRSSDNTYQHDGEQLMIGDLQKTDDRRI